MQHFPCEWFEAGVKSAGFSREVSVNTPQTSLFRTAEKFSLMVKEVKIVVAIWLSFRYCRATDGYFCRIFFTQQFIFR